MALRYLDSNAGAGSGDGTDWANAFDTLTLAFAGSIAGDTIYVAQNHSETTAAAITLTSPGTLATPCFIICVNSAGTVPPVAADITTGGLVATTGASNISFAGVAYCEGVTFQAGSAASAASLRYGTNGAFHWQFKNCLMQLNNTSTSSVIAIPNGTPGTGYFDNCPFQFGNTSQSVTSAGTFQWKNTASALPGTVPNTLFNGSSVTGNFLVHGVDLSAAVSGKTLFGANVTTSLVARVVDCKLGHTAGTPVTKAASPTVRGANIVFSRCAHDDTNYTFDKFTYEGTESTEITIVRSGGASNGTTGVAKKIITTANSEWIAPFECLPIAIWNETVGSVTVTVFGIWGGGAVPNNDEIWFDVQYLDDGSFPIQSVAHTTKATILTAATATTADGSSWGGSTTAFRMATTITPAEKGIMYVVVKAATASTTFYIDPKVVLS